MTKAGERLIAAANQAVAAARTPPVATQPVVHNLGHDWQVMHQHPGTREERAVFINTRSSQCMVLERLSINILRRIFKD